ncbi:4-(cytidine 5'-diphospho)-2-C-methyl-D-erythritol kinase [Phytoactinopolyspora limicola]|uniref:4-(cytidine 5'-diphospho)-2-C-methyl-D-erythritol kinase n=1 Tax=Phytoactinopolyspora limicola TaxID=2715536 RepID=UPI001A9C3209|nr:4-(cytidine 5'-diphospho)-2-C-methyl-D-erythritol kinase [Phytoactinopolyspora limicola]
MQVIVRVPAKINIVLRVGPLRSDGFHGLASLFHAVSLFDEVQARPATGGVTLELTGGYTAGVPLDHSNLAVRAAHMLAEAAGVSADVRLKVRKDIPVAAGLAGGSADAAGTLLACNQLWSLSWPRSALAELAASLGSDVPFALLGGTAVGTGRGEQLQPLDVPGELHWVLAVADGQLSTPTVFRRLDALRQVGAVPEAPVVDPAAVAAVAAGDAAALAPLLANDMQEAAMDLYPALTETLDVGRRAGALGGIVSGSGPTCVFLARDAERARAIAETLSQLDGCTAAVPVAGPAAPTQLPA